MHNDDTIPPNPMIHYLAQLAYDVAKRDVRKRLAKETEVSNDDNGANDNPTDKKDNTDG